MILFAGCWIALAQKSGFICCSGCHIAPETIAGGAKHYRFPAVLERVGGAITHFKGFT